MLGSLAFTMTCSIIAKQTLVQRGLALTRYVVLGYTSPKALVTTGENAVYEYNGLLARVAHYASHTLTKFPLLFEYRGTFQDSEVPYYVGTTYAVLIGIEDYQQSRIDAVQFAQADVFAMKQLLIDSLEVQSPNITVWINSEATRTVFENDLPYLIRQLGAEDRLIVFYAGHGFYSNGTNRLTTWDSHPDALPQTTVSLEDVLLKPLRSQPSVSVLVFIDACAAYLKANTTEARDIISDMNPVEFDTLVRTSHQSGIFFACSPHEKAYPSQILQHGIWTYHLLKALNGEAEDAIHRDRWVTGDSLKNYLAAAVPDFIRKRTEIRGQQRPYAILSSNGVFGIHQIPEPEEAEDALPKLSFKFDAARFVGIETIPYKDLEGFEKKSGHFVPTYVSERTSAFGKRLLDDDVVAELEEMKDKAKEVLGTKRRGVEMSNDGEAGGSIDTELFRYAVNAGQSSVDPSKMRIVRTLLLRKPLKELPEDFDDIFIAKLDELVIPVDFDGADYEDIADALEAFADENDGEFSEIASEGTITLTFRERRLRIVFRSDKKTVRFSGMGISGPVQLSRLLGESAVRLLLGGRSVTMLGSPLKRD